MVVVAPTWGRRRARLGVGAFRLVLIVVEKWMMNQRELQTALSLTQRENRRLVCVEDVHVKEVGEWGHLSHLWVWPLV